MHRASRLTPVLTKVPFLSRASVQRAQASYGTSSTGSDGLKIDIKKAEVNDDNLGSRSSRAPAGGMLIDETTVPTGQEALKIESDPNPTQRNIYEIHASLDGSDKIATEHELFESVEELMNLSFSAPTGNKQVVMTHAWNEQIGQIKDALAPRMNTVEKSTNREIYETDNKDGRLIYRPVSGKNKETGAVIEVHSQTKTEHTSNFPTVNNNTGDIQEKTITGPMHKFHTTKPKF